jgi:Flp pilus assembly protein TadD
MKSHLSAVLFALLIPLTACGGDRASSKPTPTPAPVVVQAPAPVPVVEPKPVAKVEIVSVEALPAKYVDCMTEGKLAAGKGDHAKARELFEEAAKLDKKQVDPHIELARSFIATSERGLAIKSATKATKLAPESGKAWNTLGRAELLRHNYDGAILAFRQSTELEPSNPWAWNNLGLVYMTVKDYVEATTALAEATSKPGAEGYMFNNLGLAYEQLDQLDDARIAFDKGGELGSVEAKASRKRLEGVKTVVVMETAKDEPVDKVEPTQVEKTYDNAEPMPDLPPTQDGDGSEDEVEAKPDAEPATSM